MLCIIGGHLGVNIVTRIVFTVHVPLFFFCSGYFYKNGRTKTTVLKLIKPYIFTAVVLLIITLFKDITKVIIFHSGNDLKLYSDIREWFLSVFYGSGSRHDFFSFDLPVIGGIWFLLALSWSECLFSLVCYLFKKCKKYYMLVALYFVSIFLWLLGFISAQYTWIPLSLQAACSAMVFMTVGYHARLVRFVEKYKRNWALLFAAISVWGLSIYFSIVNDNMSLVRSSYPNPLINVMGAIAGTWVILFISDFMGKFSWSKLFSTIGQYSLIAMSFHCIEQVFPWNIVQHILGETSGLILIFVAKIIWVLFGIWISRKVGFLRNIYSVKDYC